MRQPILHIVVYGADLKTQALTRTSQAKVVCTQESVYTQCLEYVDKLNVLTFSEKCSTPWKSTSALPKGSFNPNIYMTLSCKTDTNLNDLSTF